jgi:hypothetical protein
MKTFSCFNDKIAVINQAGLNETIQNLYGSISDRSRIRCGGSYQEVRKFISNSTSLTLLFFPLY